MKIEMTKCDHCGELTKEAPLKIGVTYSPRLRITTGNLGAGGYDEVQEACGPACRIKLISKLLDGETTEHSA